MKEYSKDDYKQDSGLMFSNSWFAGVSYCVHTWYVYNAQAIAIQAL